MKTLTLAFCTLLLTACATERVTYTLMDCPAPLTIKACQERGR